MAGDHSIEKKRFDNKADLLQLLSSWDYPRFDFDL